jgi:hypothetical protein
MEQETGKRSTQLPEYESPTLISLTKVQSGHGQGTECLAGQQATVTCGTGYSAFQTCAPTGLSAGPGCSTGAFPTS